MVPERDEAEGDKLDRLTFWDVRRGDAEAITVLENLHSLVLSEAIQLAGQPNEVQEARGFDSHESLMALGVLLDARQHLARRRTSGVPYAAWFFASEVQ